MNIELKFNAIKDSIESPRQLSTTLKFHHLSVKHAILIFSEHNFQYNGGNMIERLGSSRMQSYLRSRATVSLFHKVDVTDSRR